MSVTVERICATQFVCVYVRERERERERERLPATMLALAAPPVIKDISPNT